MENRIEQALTKLFENHRIVFWYDVKNELYADFKALTLPDVEKLELNNNEYGIKYKILREQVKDKFLLYRAGAQPADQDNWLLDVQLAHTEFRTDQVALWLADLELGFEFTKVVQEHVKFFQAIKRKYDLKAILKSDDTIGIIRLKMLALCVNSDPRIDSALENLLQELAKGRDEKMKLVTNCNLHDFFWEQMTYHYGYKSDEPSIRDFAIELFKSCYAMNIANLSDKVKLNSDALVFLKRWKDSRLYEESFETLSNEYADILDIEQDLAARDFKDLITLDYFLLIDKKIISDLVQAVILRTVSIDAVTDWIRQRSQSHWYSKYKDLYEAINYATQFIHSLSETNFEMNSLSDGVQFYSSSWYKLDQFYRKYIYHTRMSGQMSVLAVLSEQIENLYANSYLLKLGDNFQTFVDKSAKWEAGSILKQNDFFKEKVQPFLSKKNKVCVIISDAMRYEIGDELLKLIRQENRYSADIEPMLSMLPSYTQLGMAALLPNKELAIGDNAKGIVLVDGQSSQGTVNRSKILAQSIQRAAACKVAEFMAMNREEQRTLVCEHDVIYIYHNHIDAIGDKRDSEERVFEAVEKTLQEIIDLIKKLTGANANNLLVTSDHGFIYQNRPIAESDFIVESDFSNVIVEGEHILFQDRRFVFGKNLINMAGLHKFTSAQLDLVGEVEVQIAKSINRLRLSGSGSRFVHGGASLQEVVIPVIMINKKRKDDISVVEVDILHGASSMITSGQLAVIFYQTRPLSDKIQPRVLRAGLYTKAGVLLSDSHDLSFNLTAENARQRELQVRFMLTRKADEFNGQDVILKLEEKDKTSSHYKEYKSLRYTIRRSFTSDFDF